MRWSRWQRSHLLQRRCHSWNSLTSIYCERTSAMLRIPIFNLSCSRWGKECALPIGDSRWRHATTQKLRPTKVGSRPSLGHGRRVEGKENRVRGWSTSAWTLSGNVYLFHRLAIVNLCHLTGYMHIQRPQNISQLNIKEVITIRAHLIATCNYILVSCPYTCSRVNWNILKLQKCLTIFCMNTMVFYLCTTCRHGFNLRRLSQPFARLLPNNTMT